MSRQQSSADASLSKSGASIIYIGGQAASEGLELRNTNKSSFFAVQSR